MLRVYHFLLNTAIMWSYEVAEKGRILLVTNKDTSKDWLAVLKAATLKNGDIIVVDPFCSAAWQDAHVDLGENLVELRLNTHYMPVIEEMQDALMAYQTG